MEGADRVDHGADIYSLGVVLYEMLTGELPLGRFEPPSHRVQVDVRLDEVVLRTLERDPERRYQHASDVKTDIESIASATSGGGGSRPAASAAPEPEPGSVPPVRQRMSIVPLAFFVGIGALQFATCGLSLWHLLRVIATGDFVILPVAFAFLINLLGGAAGLAAVVGGLVAWWRGTVWRRRRLGNFIRPGRRGCWVYPRGSGRCGPHGVTQVLRRKTSLRRNHTAATQDDRRCDRGLADTHLGDFGGPLRGQPTAWRGGPGGECRRVRMVAVVRRRPRCPRRGRSDPADACGVGGGDRLSSRALSEQVQQLMRRRLSVKRP